MYIYYRTSDKGNIKEKIRGATREACLKMAMDEFGKEYFCIIADNCNNNTLEWLYSLGTRVVSTSLGNSKSFQYIVDLAIEERDDNEIVYFLEDDYLHKIGSKAVLEEGVSIADYVTLYDHPDYYQYKPINGKIYNPLMEKDWPKTRVYRGEKCHWRETYSTTMTFATRVSVLKHDRDVFLKHTKENIPHDFDLWMNLTNDSFFNVIRLLVEGYYKTALSSFEALFRRKRKLINPVPGFSTHTEIPFQSPGVNWEKLVEEREKNAKE